MQPTFMGAEEGAGIPARAGTARTRAATAALKIISTALICCEFKRLNEGV